MRAIRSLFEYAIFCIKAKSDPKTVAAVNQNIQLANSFVASGETSSVINQKLVPPTGDKHDYSSLYWVCYVERCC